MNFLLPLLAAMASRFALEAAASAGHETGIKVVANLFPHFTDKQVLIVYHAMLKEAQRFAATLHNGATSPSFEEVVGSLVMPLNPDGSIPVSNPVTPPPPEPM